MCGEGYDYVIMLDYHSSCAYVQVNRLGRSVAVGRDRGQVERLDKVRFRRQTRQGERFNHTPARITSVSHHLVLQEVDQNVLLVKIMIVVFKSVVNLW